MKKFLCLCAMFMIGAGAFAYDDFRPFETREQAYDRQSYNNYNTYQNNNYQAPLGGYHQNLGSTTQGEQYGYNKRSHYDRNSGVRGMTEKAGSWY